MKQASKINQKAALYPITVLPQLHQCAHLAWHVSVVDEGPALGKTTLASAVPVASTGLLALWKLASKEFLW